MAGTSIYDPLQPQSDIPGGGGPGTPKKKKHPQPQAPAPGPQPREPQQVPGPTGGSQSTNPQAPAPQQVDPYHGYEQAMIHDRLNHFPGEMIQESPYTVAGLAFSNIDHYSLQKIAVGLRTAWPWLKAKYGFNGVPGSGLAAAAFYYSTPQARAILGRIAMMQEQAARQYGNQLVSSVGDIVNMNAAEAQVHMVEAAQARAIAEIRANQYISQADQVAQIAALKESVKNQLGSLYHPGAGGPLQQAKAAGLQVDTSTGQVGTGTSGPTAGILQMLQQGTSQDLNWLLGPITNGPLKPVWDHLNQTLYEMTSLQKNPEIMDGPTAELYQNDPGALATMAMLGLAGKPFEAASRVAKWLGSGSESLPYGKQLHQGLEGLFYLPAKAFQWTSKIANQAGGTVADIMGLKPGTPDYTAVQATAAFIVQWELGKVGGEVAAGFKLGRSQPWDIIKPEGMKAAELRAAGKEVGLKYSHFEGPGSRTRAQLSPAMLGKRGVVSRIHGVIGQMGFEAGPAARALNPAYMARMLMKLGTEDQMTWFDWGPGRRFVSDVQRMVQTYGKGSEQTFGALVDQGVPYEWAKDLVGKDTRQGIRDYMLERVRKPTQDTIETYREMLRKAKEDQKDPTLLPDERAQAYAKRIQAQSWLDALKPDEVPWRVPKPSLWRKIERNTAVGPLPVRGFIAIAHHLYNPDSLFFLRKLPFSQQRVRAASLSRAFDDWSQEVLYVPGAEGSPVDAMAINADTVGKISRRAGVPDSAIRLLLAKLGQAKDETQFKQVLVNDFSSALEQADAISLDMRKAVSERFKNSVYSSQSKSMLGEELTLANGQTVIIPRDLLTRADTGSPLVTESAQFLSHPVPVPSLEMMREATSWSRSVLRRLRRTYKTRTEEEGDVRAWSGGKRVWKVNETPNVGGLRLSKKELRQLSEGHRAVAYGKEIEQTTALAGGSRLNIKGIAAKGGLLPVDIAHGILDTATMIGKPLVLVPRALSSLLLRIQGEQALRAYFMGYEPLVLFKDKAIMAQAKPLIGTLARDAFDTARQTTEYHVWDLRNYRPDIGGVPDAAWDAIHRRIQMIRSSPEVMELLRKEGTFPAWATSEDPKALIYRRQFQPIFDASKEYEGKTFEEQVRLWSQDKMKEVHQLTGGNQALIDALHSGVWEPRGAVEADAVRAYGADETMQEEWLRHQETKQQLDGLITKGYWDPDVSVASVRALQDLRLEHLDAMARLEEQGLSPRERGSFAVSLDDAFSMRKALDQTWRDGEYQLPQSVVGERKMGQMDRLKSAKNIRSAISQFLYQGLAPATWADVRGTRGSMFYQNLERNFAELAGRYGTKDTEWLFKQSFARAAHQTSDAMYDLAARSSMDSYLKNIFWFLPAYREILHTWFVKIPSRYYWPVGGAYLYHQGAAVVSFLHDVGIMQKDPRTGQDVVTNDSVKTFLDRVFGLNLQVDKGDHTIWGFNPKGLNLLSAGLPTMAPIPAIATGDLAVKHGGIFKWLSDKLTWAGADTSVGPTALNYAWELATGDVPWWERFSPTIQQAHYDISRNEAGRYSYYMMYQQGDRLPLPEDPRYYNNQAALIKATNAWYGRWSDETNSILNGVYMTKLLGSTISPAALFQTSSYEMEKSDVLNKIKAAGDILPDGSFNAKGQKMYDQFFAERGPASLAYRVPLTESIPGAPQTPFNADLNTALHGYLQVVPWKEFQDRAAVLASSAHFSAMRQRAYGDMTPPEALINRGLPAALASINDLQDRWQRANSIAQSEWETFIKMKAGDIPMTVTIERITEAKRDLQLLQNFFTSGGIRDADFKTVVGNLDKLLSDQGAFKSTGPQTPLQKGVSWWYDNVMKPQMNELEGLYSKADEMRAQGVDPGAVYQQISDIKNANNHKFKGPDGYMYPSLEEYFFDHLLKPERSRKVAHWLTEPTAWLSEFERSKIGIADDPKYTAMFKGIQKRADYLSNILAGKVPNVRPTKVTSTKDRDSLTAWNTQNTKDWIVKNYGKKGLHLWHLSEAPPYQRLLYAGYGQGSGGEDSFKKVADWAKWFADKIEHPWPSRPDLGYTIEGDSSATQAYYKNWFFQDIDKLRAKNNGDNPFNDMLHQLGYAMPPSGGLYREGYQLYDALFFNQFRSSLAPENLNITYGNGSGATQPTTTGTGNYANFAPEAYITNYQNGRVPTGAMIPVATTAEGNVGYNTGGNYYLRPDAAMSFLAMQAAIKQDLGYDISTMIDNTYRTRAQDIQIQNSPVKMKASLGSSDHGYGLAFDLTSTDPGYQQVHDWILTHAVQYGWINAAVPNQLGGGWDAPNGDAHHFSFAAGGAQGGGVWNAPLPSDQRWIQQARDYGTQTDATVKNYTTAQQLATSAARASGVTGASQWANDPKFWYILGHESTIGPDSSRSDLKAAALKVNPKSQHHARGIGQFQDGTWNNYGGFTPDPYLQMQLIFKYIYDTYHTLDAAYQHSISTGWY